MNPLSTLLKSDASQVDSLTIKQVLALCGDGVLTDCSKTSEDLRWYLNVATTANLAKYCATCLDEPFPDSGLVLQDLVSELGRRLEYSVEGGAYRGKSGSIGFDGIWRGQSGEAIVVEVKTTDAYRINLDTIAGYREKLQSSGLITAASSILLVVGRQDTGDLEAQIRGSRHAWGVRIISVKALILLVQLKENGGITSVRRIHELLVPFEYTRLDAIIDIAFAVAEEASNAAVGDFQDAAPIVSVATENHSQPSAQLQSRTPRVEIDKLRDDIVLKLSAEVEPLVKKSRALYWSANKQVRAAITVSKEYKVKDYWFAYHPYWDEFLKESETGLYVLGCLGLSRAFAIPRSWISNRLPHLYSTGQGVDKYWHVVIWRDEQEHMLLGLNNGKNEMLDQFAISIQIG